MALLHDRARHVRLFVGCPGSVANRDSPARLLVVTSLECSSSLVFDTLYAEGQRRYVETFSAYARQFLDRMDKPAVDRLVDGVPRPLPSTRPTRCAARAPPWAR